MKLILQRVRESSVIVEKKEIARISKGILIFVGFCQKDQDLTEKILQKSVNKVLNLRIFPDSNQKMNLNIMDIEGQILIVSQFTLCGDPYKGNRPSFSNALSLDIAKYRYEQWVKMLRKTYFDMYYQKYTAKPEIADKVQTGEFQADMKVHLTNDGPVTFILEY